MKEIELELQDNGILQDKNSKLKKRCAFVEQKKREARLRRRKPSTFPLPSLLIIAGRAKTVHTVKEKFQERIVKTNKEDCESQHKGEKLLLDLKQLHDEETTCNYQYVNKNNTEKLSLPPIQQQNIFCTDGNDNSNNSIFPRKIKISKKRNYKPSRSFNFVLPPIQESNSVDGSNLTTNGENVSCTPLPSLEKQN